MKQMRYTQAQPGGRPTLIEANLLLPGSSTTEITLDVDKAYMRYTDYPPDAQRGFDVPSGIVLLPGVALPAMRIYTTSTLLDMPTPDFSMPYNVIILTCKDEHYTPTKSIAEEKARKAQSSHFSSAMYSIC